jgi:hypothetical protein
MLRTHVFWYGVGAGLVGLWVYHHFAPGKGIGQPGSVTGS